MALDSKFALGLDGRPNLDCVVQGERYRFTVLTTRMLRMEYAEDGQFEDRPTQVVWNRSFDHPEFIVKDREDLLEIDTEFFHLVYDKREFNQNHLYIDVKYNFTNYGGRWYYGQKDYGDPKREHNLKGTARTLDRCDGPWYVGANRLERMRTNGTGNNRCDGDADLGRGLCDTSGRTFFEDGTSLIMLPDGFVEPRRKDCIDTYFMGYGRDYFGAIHDFYRLSGPPPLMPRYVLGNWWSRYWKYSEESYMELLKAFESRKIPFSVVVMDMDWHLVDIPERFGKGWTGYTWNRELFPDPKRFLDWLHAHHYRITLNLHPADGVRAYEEQYPAMARELGMDPDSGFPVRFDFTNTEFITAYFRYLHHPEEERGVDFWWMDWQQGNVSMVDGMDPLWMLNHYHHYDLKSQNKRAVMLSRYSGLGSHRYPMGFSGDVHTTWQSLEYQPYFTATAANVGYTWWSHDIGGHLNGIKDNELYIRWLEFGIFSPINRLHSNSDPFCAKEPWRYPRPYDEYAAELLRLRHRLLPYLYTMNYQCHTEMVPVVVPVYYHYPMHADSYRFRNEYFFGTELLIQSMVHPTDPETGFTTESTWLPPGIWTDFYDGKIYDGGRQGECRRISRTIDRQGVLAKPGAIVPMARLAEGESAADNPETLEICIFPGADNEYVLYEDAGDGFAYEKGQYLQTRMKLCWQEGKASFELQTNGDREVIPKARKYVLHFRGFSDIETEQLEVSESFEKSYSDVSRTLTVALMGTDPGRKVAVTLNGAALPQEENLVKRVFTFLDGVQGSIVRKGDVMRCVRNASDKEEMISGLRGLDLPKSWEDVLMEMILR